jgi:protein TonB
MPEPPAPVSAAPPPAPTVNEDAMTRYAAAIHSIVYSNLQVPDQIAESGLSGNCTLQFTVAPDGTLLDVEVIDQAGLASVNQAALDALRGSRLPPFTAGMPTGPHVFTMVVHVDANGGDQ